MKNITIAGGITKNAEVRRTQNGDAICAFSVAVSEGYGDNKRTLYFDCSLWGKRGESLAQHLTKGSKVTVCGELSTREYEGKTYLTIRANDLTLQGGAQGGDRAPSRQGGDRVPDARPDLDDEIPF